MASEHQRWAREFPRGSFKASERAVLKTLAEYAGQDDLAFLKKARIANENDLDERTVQRAFEALVKKGVITRVGMRGKATQFRLNLPKGDTMPPPRETPRPPKGDTMPPPRETPRPPRGDTTPPPWERDKEKELEEDGRGTPQPSPAQLQEDSEMISPPRNSILPPGAFRTEDWQEACALADLIEASGLPVDDLQGETRAKALALFAEAWPERPWCRDKAQPWQDIRSALEWATRDGAGPEEGDILEALRKYPDGAFPADGAGRPSRLERLIRRHKESAPPPDPLRREAPAPVVPVVGTFAPPTLPRDLVPEADASPGEAVPIALASINGASGPTPEQLAKTREQIRLAAKNPRDFRHHRARRIHNGLESPEDEARAAAEKDLAECCAADLRYQEGREAVGIR